MVEGACKISSINQPNLKENLCNTTQPLYCKQETVMTRLRIGHTWITHSYLLKKEDQPFCHACDNPFTVKHILVDCSDFTHTRNKYYTTTDVHTLFREVDSSKITEYLKEIKLIKFKFTSNTISRETRIFNIYTFIF